MVFADAIAWGFAISFWASAELATTRLPTKQIARRWAEDRIRTTEMSNESVHPCRLCVNSNACSQLSRLAQAALSNCKRVFGWMRFQDLSRTRLGSRARLMTP